MYTRTSRRRFLAVLCCIAALCCVSRGLAEEEPAQKANIPAPAGGKPCQGTLVIGKSSYKLAHVAVYETTVFDDDESYAVLLSSAPIPVDKLKAKLQEGKGQDGGFIFFQPHVKVNFRKSGEVMFYNLWADNFSVGGSSSKLTGKLLVEAGRVRGQLAMPADADDKKPVSFEAIFDTPLIAVAVPKPAAKPTTKDKPVAKDSDDDDDDDDDKPAAGPKINYRDLPLPKDAADVEYKKNVEQIRYKSGLQYKALAKSLAQQLDAQGWKSKGPDLLGVSAILHRNLGGAELTIMIKPAGAGSTVWITSKGLSWEEKQAEDPSK